MSEQDYYDKLQHQNKLREYQIQHDVITNKHTVSNFFWSTWETLVVIRHEH